MVGFYRLNELGFSLESGTFVLKASDFDPILEANRLLEAAEAHGQEIVADAQKVYESEKQRGYLEGLEEARVASIERLLKENRVLDAGIQKIEQDMAKLVMTCVQKLVTSFEDIDRARAVVTHALAQMRREKRAELRVPPKLYETFKAEMDHILKEFPEIEMIDVVKDMNLEGSHVIVETSVGRVDGDLGQRMQDLELVIRRVYTGAIEDLMPLAEKETIVDTKSSDANVPKEWYNEQAVEEPHEEEEWGLHEHEEEPEEWESAEEEEDEETWVDEEEEEDDDDDEEGDEEEEEEDG